MSQQTKPFIIAIDGHSSTGKSTVAKSLAKQLGYVYVDTGAMYRSVTLFAMRNGAIDDNGIDENALVALLDDITIDFSFNPETEKNVTFLNGENVEDEIRGLAVASNVSAVSAIKAVRIKLVALQRAVGERQNIVMDGRDIGSVVFPQADLKLFMTASPQVRAQRRYDELVSKGETVSFDDILKNVTDRDFEDENRDESPLCQTKDSLLLDNSTMTREEQLEWIVDKVRQLKS